jgi:hypothetical protein
MWLVARNSHGGNAKIGAEAGTLGGNGKTSWWQIGIDRKHYRAHRLAWFWMTGEWPPGEIDHENRDPLDNKWKNLRLATRAQNAANMSGKRPSHGLKGAYKSKRSGRWFSQISIDCKSVFLGRFDTAQEAHEAYMTAARKHFAGFASAK